MNEFISKIEELLSTGGKDWKWVYTLVQKYFETKGAKAEKWRKYYFANKDRLNKYQADYRRKHPEYEDRRRERARNRKNNA